MVEDHYDDLTEEEAELYDRQIRLWGLESQKRLRGARVLLAGLQGIGAEIAKNVILAGVKSLTLLDSENVNAEDACSQFLAPRDQIGKNRAEASLARAKALNPMVQIVADTAPLQDKSVEFFADFDVVCVTQYPVAELIRVNNICRKKKIKFFCTAVWGTFGYTFTDLLVHSYVADVTKFKKADASDPKKGSKFETVITTSPFRTTYVPLRDVIDRDMIPGDIMKHLKRNGPAFLLMKILHAFHKENGRYPLPANRVEDLKKLGKLRDDLLEQHSIDAALFPTEYFTHVFAQISPACAVVGGVLGQEIIKALSQKEAPHDNFFFFDPIRCAGFIEKVH